MIATVKNLYRRLVAADPRTTAPAGRRWHPRLQDVLGGVYPRAHTPASVKSLLRSAADGFPFRQNDFIDEMLESGDPVAGVWAQRKHALIGDDWDIVPATEVSKSPRLDAALAQSVADDVRAKLSQIDNFGGFLADQADAVGYSYAVAEIVWLFENGEHRPSQIISVNRNSITADPGEPWRLRVATTEAGGRGELLDDHPNKWVVHIPNPIGGLPFRGGVLRGCIVYHMIRRYGFQWMTSFTELFGTPFRVGKYPINASSTEKDELLAMLRDFGNAAYGIFAEGTGVEFVEASKSGDALPHKTLIDMIDDWCKIRIVGQTLTTDVGTDTGGGSFALGKVQKGVRDDLIASDRVAEANTIRQQLLKPIVALSRFGPTAPVPYFVRRSATRQDLDLAGRTLSVAVNDLGMNVSLEFAHELLEIPLTNTDKLNPAATLPGRPGTGAPAPVPPPSAPPASVEGAP